MSQGHTAAVDVYTGGIQFQHLVDPDGSSGKGLVDLKQINIGNVEPLFFQHLGDGVNGRHENIFHVNAKGSLGTDFGQNGAAQFPGLFLAHDHKSGCTVRNYGGIARSAQPVFFKGSSHLGQGFIA